jgi:tetratricopeptide (TPR) repeat protein
LKANYLKISIIIALVVFSSGCRSKKNTLIKRAYHDITAHYNGYFNAKLKIDNTEKQNEKSFQDKYDDILPVFKILRDESGSSSSKGGGNQSLDEAIKKASLVVQRHEISKWIDDCYFEIGRAYFYKKDYFTAAETFQFAAGRYKDKEVGDKSYIWLIKSYLLLKKYNQAESVINIALASETFPKKYISELFATVAWYYIDKKNYAKAVEYLEKAIVTERKKNKRARYTYISAQLLEKMNEDGKAGIKYLQVVKMNPAYDLLFNARINSARLVQNNSIGSKKNLEKELLKMLNDAKNKEFRDQIYYSLGLIYEKEGDDDKMLRAFKSSAATSLTNLSQKGLAYLKLANIYYDEENYQIAQMYYDSSSTFLPKSNPDYEFVNKRKNSLAKLVENLLIIKREDSLIRLSRMPEADRIAYVEKVIKKEKEEKARKEEEEKRLAEQALNNLSRPTDNNGLAGANVNAGGTWYFYNQNSLGIGTSDFVKKFGRRVLEDNWRRSNKESFASLNNSGNSEAIAEEKGVGTNANDDAAIKKRYLANIPTSPTALIASTDKIVRAYYNIGQFYREEIINLNESIKAYETCVSQFPENKLRPEIYFNLYRLYAEINNKTQSEYYKNKILNEFPNTLIAKVILDPSYISEAKATDIAAQHFYDNIYDAYKNGSYEAVFVSKTRIDTQYSKTSIAPKYYYLYALTQNKVNGVTAFEASLQKLLNDFPSSDAASMAREHLKKIEEQKNPSLKNLREEDPVSFELEERSKYFVMISTDNSSIRDTKNNLARFNFTEFSMKSLRINSELVGEKEQIILVEQFSDLQSAKEYLTALNKKLVDVIKLKPNSYALSFISEKNLKILRESKSINKYLQFYNGNYQINEE